MFFFIIFFSCEVEKDDFYPAVNVENQYLLSQDKIDITFTNLVDQDRYFDPSFVAIGFKARGRDIQEADYKVYFPKAVEHKSFDLDLKALAKNYTESSQMDFSFTNAESVMVSVYTEDEGQQFYSKTSKFNEATYQVSTGSEENQKDGCTCLYWDTFVNGVLVQSDLLGCDCPCEDTNSSITCGNGGAGGGSGVNVGNGTTPPDCESFPYGINNSYTNRIAGVHELSFHYYSFEFFSNDAVFEFDYHRYTFENPVYFTGPLFMDNGVLATLTAEAIEAVNQRLEDAFGHDGWGSNANAVENFILQALNNEMSTWGGSAGFQSNGATGNQIGVYNETWLPTSCN